MAPESETRKKAKASSLKTKDKVPEKKPKKMAASTADPAPAPKKRKAIEDSSPVAVKKTKSESKPDKAAKPKKREQAKQPEPDASIPLAAPDDNDTASDEADEGIQALVASIDPADSDQPKSLRSKYKQGQPVGKIPKVSKTVQQNASQDTSQTASRVLYIGHLPHGFYEHQMREYFEQFGPITNLRLSHNRMTGASKHFAFVEFRNAGDADIVARTMDNYLLFGHVLKCKLVPPERIHPELWKGSNQRFKKIPWQRLAGNKLAQPKTETAWQKKISRQSRKQGAKAEKLKSMGYEFEFPEMEQPVAATVLAVEE